MSFIPLCFFSTHDETLISFVFNSFNPFLTLLYCIGQISKLKMSYIDKDIFIFAVLQIVEGSFVDSNIVLIVEK